MGFINAFSEELEKLAVWMSAETLARSYLLGMSNINGLLAKGEISHPEALRRALKLTSRLRELEKLHGIPHQNVNSAIKRLKAIEDRTVQRYMSEIRSGKLPRRLGLEYIREAFKRNPPQEVPFYAHERIQERPEPTLRRPPSSGALRRMAASYLPLTLPLAAITLSAYLNYRRQHNKRKSRRQYSKRSNQ